MTFDQQTNPEVDALLLPVDFQALFAAIPTAYLVMDTDLRVIYANNAYCELLNYRREHMVGRYVFDVFPPTPESLDADGTNPVQASFERVRDNGQPDPMALQKYDLLDPDTGVVHERFWSLVSAPILDDSNNTALIVQRVEDATDFVNEREGRLAEARRGLDRDREIESIANDLYARAAELRASQQAELRAAEQLASITRIALQLASAQRIEDVEEIVVARGLSVLGADGGGIISPDGLGDWRATLSSALGEDVQIGYGNVPYDSPLPAPWVAREGTPLLFPTPKEGLAFHEPSMSLVYADINRLGWAFLPLIVEKSCIGCLAVSWADEHPFEDEELTLLNGFAAQCAQAVYRVRQSEEQQQAVDSAQRMSETLQRSLLTRPPSSDELWISVRYQPAAEQAQVGGDWYDAFKNHTGETLLIVGDVTGHDRTSAATMGQFRNLLRGISYDSDESPARLLTRLDAAVLGLNIDALATAVLARVESLEDGESQRSLQLRWSSAGHLPPLLRLADGSVTALEYEPNLLLGFNPHALRTDQTADLPPGSTLLLYTDGLVERRHSSLDEGIDRLAGQLATFGAHGPEALCNQLLHSIDADANVDDIAILVLQVQGVGESIDRARAGDFESVRGELRLPADPRSVREARQLARELCQQARLADELSDTAVLLTSEVVTNAVMHGRSEARVTVTAGIDGVRVEVADDNSKPPVLAPHDDEALSGRGVGMLDHVATDWGVRDELVGKTVWFLLRA